jgi:hypothetical protein
MNVKTKESPGKGKGLYAARDFKPGEEILYIDLTRIKKTYTQGEIERSGIDSDHWDYIGDGKYVLDYSPASYVNHSCDPNAYFEFTEPGKKYLIAIKHIKKGEEITVDYTLGAPDQIDNETWTLKCKCGSKNCRGTITGNFFKLPKELQKEKLRYLPTYTRRKYKERLRKLLED